jgi:predicted 3-demethylubiquinone-9 3-methyltransferase (glyoxalase superfamily)
MSALESYPRITPFLWFDSSAGEAADFYVSIFANSRRLDSFTPTPERPRPLIVGFELDGQKFTALNGGPGHTFTDAISLVVRCDTQQEIDFYWEKLSAGGAEGRCGWLKDKFGLSWQVIPVRLSDLIRYPAAMQAMMGMKKMDIAELERAAQS